MITWNDVEMFIGVLFFGLAYALIPASPLLMWYLADRFGVFDDD